MHDAGLGDMLQWLDTHTNLEAGGRLRVPTLERMRPLVELLGSPQHDYPVIHVTGTNGKTSTTRLAAHLLTGRGLSVGAYISPHLERVNERITWAGEPISDTHLAEALTLAAAAEQAVATGDPDRRPSYFEILTAAAFRWFADSAVEIAVVEVGLGGTWDATNVADGVVAVVTNVTLDHMEYLGSSRASIASEKAGIIKPGATLILGETDPELAPLFLEREPGRVLRAGQDFGVVRNDAAVGGRVVDLRTPAAEYRELYLPLHGSFQAENAVLAVAAAEAFFDGPLDDDVVRQAFDTFRSPGRLEVVRREPLVLLDGAHNVAGAEALLRALAEEFPPAPRTLVVGLLQDKDARLMLEALEATAAERVVVCRPPSARALEPRLLAEAALDVGVDPGRLDVAGTVEDGVTRALETAPHDGQIVVAGSLYLVGEARAVLASHLSESRP